MKNNEGAGEVTDMKFPGRRAKFKAIMKSRYGLSCFSHPTPRNWWEFEEQGQARKQLSSSLIDISH